MEWISGKCGTNISKSTPHLINQSVPGVNRLFVLSFDTGFYLPKAEIKYYNMVIDEKNFFDQTIQSS